MTKGVTKIMSCWEGKLGVFSKTRQSKSKLVESSEMKIPTNPALTIKTPFRIQTARNSK